MIKQEDKETFYKSVYEDFLNLNEKYISSILDSINICLGLELFSKTQGSYFTEVIYSVDNISIKTKILIFNAGSLSKFFRGEGKEFNATRTEIIYENWKKLKENIGASVKTKAYSKNNVAKSKVQTLDLTSEYFFRKKQGED